MKSINPSTSELIQEYDEFSKEKVSTIIGEAQKSFLSWKKSSYDSRSKKLLRLADLLEEKKDELSKLISLEMGKPLKEGSSEIEKCAWVSRYYAKNAQNFLKDEEIATEHKKSFVTYQPLGVVLAIMPWNFPFWQFFRVAAPALMVGNTVLLKHASNVSGCSLKIEELFKLAGFPEGTVQSLLLSGSKMNDVISHPLVQGVSLTGSTEAGKKVASIAGANIKKSVLELGGSDPYLILEDADVDLAVEKCAQSRLINSGQSCIGAKRFIVSSKIKKEFELKLTQKMEKVTWGNPLEGTFDIGPLARKDLRDELHEQVRLSIKTGAKCLLGGELFESHQGAFYPPTILTDVTKDMPAYHEEFFGPVASIIEAEDEEQAIEIANDTSFGLGAGIFTQDEERGLYIAKNLINSGACFINDFVKSDPRLPFGGVKESGYGRELSHHGTMEFTNIKTVCLS